jgi:asparagine synthase (glutamine-hydrolysing)
MCGIAGWVGEVSDPEEMSQCMAQCLRPRGPDGQGIFLKRRCMSCAHTRLNILDLSSTGARPMVNEDGIVWTIFNSEIYNYHDLRRDLEARGRVRALEGLPPDSRFSACADAPTRRG